MRLFDVIFSRFVTPPFDERLSLDEAGRLRDLELEAKADTPPYPCA